MARWPPPCCRWRSSSRPRASWRCRSAASSSGFTARPARASPPAWAGWTPRRSAAHWATGRRSWWERPAACAIIWNAARSICRRSGPRCSMRPTKCSTWAFARISRNCSMRRREERRTLLFSATMPKPIVALAKRYQRDALRISTGGEDRGHGDISYQAMTIAPSEIENAWSTCCAFTRRRPRSCSARRATRSGISTPA
jgi:hypothetical protein